MTDDDLLVSQGTRDWWDRLADGRPYILVRHDSIRPGDRALSSFYGEVTATEYRGDGIDGHQGQINWVTPEGASSVWNQRCDNDSPIALLARADHGHPPQRHTLMCIQLGDYRTVAYPEVCDCQTTGALTQDGLAWVIQVGLAARPDFPLIARSLAVHILRYGTAIRYDDWIWTLPNGQLAPGHEPTPGYSVITEDDLTSILQEAYQVPQDGTGAPRHLAGYVLANGVQILAEGFTPGSSTSPHHPGCSS